MTEDIEKILPEDDEATAYSKYLNWLYNQFREAEELAEKEKNKVTKDV